MDKAIAARSKLARDYSENIREVIEDVKAEGATSLRQIAEALNNRGGKTRKGIDWSATAVMRMLIG